MRLLLAPFWSIGYEPCFLSMKLCFSFIITTLNAMQVVHAAMEQA